MFRGGATTNDGSKLLILGLSHENIERLKLDQPIMVDLADWGTPGIKLMLFSGETEESMGRDLQQMIGPDTKIGIDPRLFNGGD